MTIYRAPSLDKAAPIVDAQGRISPYFQRFWQNLSFTADTGANQIEDITALETAVTTINGQITVLTSAKAPLASPALTGNPTAPTPSPGDNDTSVATTAFVTAALVFKAPLASPTFTGTPAGPTASPGTNSTQLATTAYVDAADALKAALASPTFTGDPKAPTPTAGDNDTSIATTAFVTTHTVARSTFITWAAATGTAERTTFATYTAPTVSAGYVQAEAQAVADHVQILSRRLKALIDDLKI